MTTDADEVIDVPGRLLERVFAENVRARREELGVSQGEIARRMARRGWDGFHQTTISRIEKYERPVRLGEAQALAEVLDTTERDLRRHAGVLALARDVRVEMDRLNTARFGLRHAVQDYLDLVRTGFTYDVGGARRELQRLVDSGEVSSLDSEFAMRLIATVEMYQSEGDVIAFVQRTVEEYEQQMPVVARMMDAAKGGSAGSDDG